MNDDDFWDVVNAAFKELLFAAKEYRKGNHAHALVHVQQAKERLKVIPAQSVGDVDFINPDREEGPYWPPR